MIGGDPVTGSAYGKPNRTIQLSNVMCSGSESSLDGCDSTLLTPEEGRNLFSHVNVAGVKCLSNVTSNEQSKQPVHVELGIMGVLIAFLVVIIVRLVQY